MDEARAEQLGIEPIAGMLAAIDRLQTKADLAADVGRPHPAGVTGTFGCSVEPDAKKSDQYIIYLSQAASGFRTAITTGMPSTRTSSPPTAARRAHADVGQGRRCQSGRRR